MPNPLAAPQTARVRLRLGRARFAASVTVTPAGLLAIGGLVAATLLSVPPIIRAARGRAVRHSAAPHLTEHAFPLISA